MTQRANDFLIWRAGSSVNWECTAQEIADETGIPKSTVQQACNRRRWKIQNGVSVNQGNINRPSLVTVMSSFYLAARS